MDPASSPASHAERLAEAERSRVAALGRLAGRAQALDGRTGKVSARILIAMRAVYRRGRVTLGRPV